MQPYDIEILRSTRQGTKTMNPIQKAIFVMSQSTRFKKKGIPNLTQGLPNFSALHKLFEQLLNSIATMRSSCWISSSGSLANGNGMWYEKSEWKRFFYEQPIQDGFL